MSFARQENNKFDVESGYNLHAKWTEPESLSNASKRMQGRFGLS